MNFEFKNAPITLLGSLLGGLLLFGLNLYFPVPFEGLIATMGILVLSTGLMYGLVAGTQSIATLLSSKRRRLYGILTPALTITIAVGSWTIVVNETLKAVHSLEKRADTEKSIASPDQDLL